MTYTPGVSDPYKCPYCGMTHDSVCPRVKAFEYHPDGRLKRVEFHEPQPIRWTAPGSLPNLGPIGDDINAPRNT